MRDILDSISSKDIILKIDIEAYECKVYKILFLKISQVSIKALQPEILLNQVGKFIPYIFIEWGHLSKNKETCGNFSQWVTNFYQGGYVPVNPGKSAWDESDW